MMPRKSAHHFSRRTPLNFFGDFLTAMNCPPSLLRLVEVFVSEFLNCVRFFTAPVRALSPIGLLTAMDVSQLGKNAGQKCFVPARNSKSGSALYRQQKGGSHGLVEALCYGFSA